MIPIIFRPFHEVTMYKHPPGWFKPFFWWHQVGNGSSPQDFKTMWSNTIRGLNNGGATNLVNAFCINDFFIDGNTNKIYNNILQLLPDNDLYDIVCFDAYQRLNTQTQKNNHPNCNTTQVGDANYNNTNFKNRMIAQVAAIHQLAVDLHKIPAIGEIGADYFFDNPTWWTSTLQPILNASQIAYINTWRNPYFKIGDGTSDKSAYYSAYNNPNANGDVSDRDNRFLGDFINFYNNNDRVLFLEQIRL